jgi:diguanylate cyclase (GGDEF)-like protein/PAS domain S-box-containing protein
LKLNNIFTFLRQFVCKLAQGNMLDITGRKLAERRQREAAERMQYMIATSPTILFASRMEENCLVTHWVSDNITRILGYTIDEVLQPDWWITHIHAGDRERVLLDSAVLFEGTQQAYEYRFIHKNGAVLWMRDEQQLIRDNAGRVTEVLKAWTDITERKHEELELRIAATAFETQEGIIITDRENRILRINRAFTRLTGYSAEEVIGKTPALLKSGRQDAEFYRKMWDAIERNKYWEGEIWNRRKNGDVYPEWLIITAIPDARGKIANYVAAFLDITQMKKKEAEIHALAFYDPLTQLPNRRLLYNRLDHALALSKRCRLHGALIFLDLDQFKIINDTQGHAVGDQVLVETARRLLAVVREIDTVARLGGDEFVVMLEDLSAEPDEAAAQAQTIAEKINRALAEPYRLDSKLGETGKLSIEHYSSASTGVTLFLDHAESANELMKRADMAMYQAKHSGRNTICFFDPQMQSALHARAELEKDLHLALDNNEFCLHYQLQVDTYGRPISAEALLRWEHPQRGNVPPAQFIPFAEESGLITRIGNWVLLQACATLAGWAPRAHLCNLKLAVNVSSRQFKQADFVDQIRGALENSGANPKQLKLEITESLIMHNLEENIVKMRAIRELGVNFAMDDFGTGYSSLSYLQRLPLEQLKIDRSFIRDLTEDSHDAAIIRTILTLGKSLEIAIIAEGVETAGQHAYLVEHGCPVFQGFLYGKPMPLAEFEACVLAGLHDGLPLQPEPEEN